jgi:Reverse transcriptase (RNA-dependent DNA polymerase)
LDATIRNDSKMKESDRLIKMKHIVSKLKGDIPENFQDAYNHPDEKLRAKWRAAIRKEFRDMIKRGVWRNMKKKDIPKGRRCIKSRWVFDVKRNGIFRARLVACGYSQVPGVDFTESYAPVISDVTWRILIVIKLLLRLNAKIVDVETAFLHGDLEEEIYMEVPEGYGLDKKENCVLLVKSIYGLVQSARMYFLKFMKVLRKIGFVGGYADPCLMVRRNDNGVVYIAIWVDDSLLIGHNAAIEQTIKDLQENGFNLKIEGELDDYLSCEISFSRDKSKGWIHQPHLIKKIEKKFGPLVKSLQRYKTPGTPGGSILRNTNAKIDEEKQKLYRSGVGMLLYLVKHSRPDIANAVRELSKALDGTSPAAYKELLRVLKYVLDTKNLSLKLQPKKEEGKTYWNIVAYSDSDFAGDNETRISIAGFILYLMGVPISWKSKGQKSVTLSSSEAEFVALSEAAKEIKFVFQVLQSMGIRVTLPIIVRVDNIGAIFIGSNVAVSQRSKHIDVRYHFVREFVHDGFLRIIFVRTKDNDADIFTKNLSGELHDRHATKMVEVKGG